MPRFLAVAMLAAQVTTGLDVRFGWSDAPALISVPGLTLFVAGNALASCTMAANRFFSRGVRIQDDRGHEVCTWGPYRPVRHPRYAGMILYSLAMAPSLGSWWALLPAALSAAGFVTRTALEDRFLIRELPGYVDYSERVRSRLLPGVW